MSLLFDAGDSRIDFVLHPTDLSRAAERAFDHALAIAVRTGAQLTLLHARGRRTTDNWKGFPSVRSKLSRWRKAGALSGIEETARRSSVSKLEVETRDPVAASGKYIERHAVDLITIATEGRRGRFRVIRASTAERLARLTRLPTLFVPAEGRTFVDGRTGRISLRKILIPVDSATNPRPAMERAVRSAALLDDPSLEITLLHVSDEKEIMRTEVPELPYCRWHVEQRRGPIVEGILRRSDEISADAIFMSTTWSKGGFGRSGHEVTEGVIDGADCPVVAVPAGHGPGSGGEWV